MFPANVQNFDFKLGMIPLLPTFNGMENENPYVYIREFEEAVATFHNKLGAMDILDWNCFSFFFERESKKLVVFIET